MQTQSVEERLRAVERALTLGVLSLRGITSPDYDDTMSDEERASALDHVSIVLDAARNDLTAVAGALPADVMNAAAGERA